MTFQLYDTETPVEPGATTGVESGSAGAAGVAGSGTPTSRRKAALVATSWFAAGAIAGGVVTAAVQGNATGSSTTQLQQGGPGGQGGFGPGGPGGQGGFGGPPGATNGTVPNGTTNGTVPNGTTNGTVPNGTTTGTSTT